MGNYYNIVVQVATTNARQQVRLFLFRVIFTKTNAFYTFSTEWTII